MTTTRPPDAASVPPPARRPIQAIAAPPPPREPAPAGDRLRLRPSEPAPAWHLPTELADAGAELRRQVALRLRSDPALQRVERQYAAGRLPLASYETERAAALERARHGAITEFEGLVSAKAGESRPYFVVKHHATLLAVYGEALGDLKGKHFQDLRWEVYGKFRATADADPEVQRLRRAHDARTKALGGKAAGDPSLVMLAARLHTRENELRVQTQDELLGGLDGRLEFDAPTRQAMRQFVAAAQPGAIGTGVWTSLTATLIRAATSKVGELDASHAFMAVRPGLFYESVEEPPPEVSGVKPTSALELFAGFHGQVRVQQIEGLTPLQAEALYAFALRHQGVPYNRLGVVLGVPGLGRKAATDRSYYCAEFVARALTKSGVPIATRAGNTVFEPGGVVVPGGRDLDQGLRVARAVPYTVVRILAPSVARRFNDVGLSLDDAIGTPRMSPQKLANARINGQPLAITFDRTPGAER